MAGSSRVRTVLLASMAMGACGGSTAQGIADADAGGTAAITPQLCDGSDSVRFAGRSDGGGPIPPGLSMLAENGWQYLIVNGTCDAWILRDTYSPIHRAKLSADLAQVFARDLSLGGWDRISVPAGGCPDAGGLSLRFGEQRLAGASCGLDPNHPFQKLATQFANQVDALWNLGTTEAATGVRYLLIMDDPGQPSTGHLESWPLATPPGEVAISMAEAYNYRAGQSHLATGSDASILRAIPGVFATNPNEPFSPVLIAGSDSQTHFRLFLRDTTPFEDTDGLLPASLF